MGNIESARDLGQGVYTKAESNALSRGFKNYIINGGFDVSQRGDYTTATSISANTVTYTVDRFIAYIYDTTGTLTHTSGHPYDASKNLRFVAGGNTSDIFSIQTKLENNLTGKTVTYSAWVKSNNSNIGLRIYDNGHIYSARHTGGGDWEKLSLTRTMTSTSSSIILSIDNRTTTYGTITSGDYIEVAQVQLEEGSVATPFEKTDPALELTRCQRYYKRLNSGRLSGVINGSGQAICTNQVIGDMRGLPSYSLTGAPGIYTMDGSSQTGGTVISVINAGSYGFQMGTSGQVNGRSFWVDLTYLNCIDLDAEL